VGIVLDLILVSLFVGILGQAVDDGCANDKHIQEVASWG